MILHNSNRAHQFGINVIDHEEITEGVYIPAPGEGGGGTPDINRPIWWFDANDGISFNPATPSKWTSKVGEAAFWETEPFNPPFALSTDNKGMSLRGQSLMARNTFQLPTDNGLAYRFWVMPRLVRNYNVFSASASQNGHKFEFLNRDPQGNPYNGIRFSLTVEDQNVRSFQLTLDQWNYVAVVFNFSAGLVRFFHQGVFVDSIFTLFTTPFVVQEAFTLFGGEANPDEFPLNDFLCNGRVMTDAEIAAEYAQLRPKYFGIIPSGEEFPDILPPLVVPDPGQLLGDITRLLPTLPEPVSIVELYKIGHNFVDNPEPWLWRSTSQEHLTPALTGQTWVAAPDGKGMRFAENLSAYGYGPFFDMQAPQFSISFWIRNVTESNQTEEIISFNSQYSLDVIKSNNGIGLAFWVVEISEPNTGILVKNGPLEFIDYETRVERFSKPAYYNLVTSPVGSFTHVAFTCNFVNGMQEIIVYANGVEVDRILPRENRVFLPPRGETRLDVGYPSFFRTIFDMDRILIFQNILTPQEVFTEYDGIKFLYQ